MARKHKCPPPGAPAWIVTYGDMMSLLLCFFIMLAAMANYDDEDKKLMAAIESIRQAFGNEAQIGYLPDEVLDFKSFLLRFDTMVVPDRMKGLGSSDEPGIDGEFYRVRKVRDGMELTVGGPIAFGRFSAVIEPASDALLKKLAEELRGKRNKIEIRGHATNEPLPPNSLFKDQLNLSAARARAVWDRLLELNIDPANLRISAAGQYEPILEQAYSDNRRAANRRVEILITQALLSDYTAQRQTEEELPDAAKQKLLRRPKVPEGDGSHPIP